MLDAGITFSLLEFLQASALLPCIFFMILLLVLKQTITEILLPACFFFALGSGFLVTIMAVHYPDYDEMIIALTVVETFHPAFCFLLILQLLYQRLPSWPYWLVLALPAIGGSSFVVASFQLQEVCVATEYCLPANALSTLYHLLATAMMFLWLVLNISYLKQSTQKNTQATINRHRYWLISALIGLYLLAMGFDLLWLADKVTKHSHDVIIAVLHIAFIYLIFTSLFRVFDTKRPLSLHQNKAKPIDPQIIDRIERLMKEQRAYRQMGFSREACAKAAAITEYHLSRAINQEFGKNFNEYVNSYRIEEAKERLEQEDTAITVIAFEVGFSSIASFNRVFKALTLLSPTEYRSKYQAAA